MYRKKDDDSLVILKEINMHDLNAAERQLALNEVRVTKSGLKVKVLDKGLSHFNIGHKALHIRCPFP